MIANAAKRRHLSCDLPTLVLWVSPECSLLLREISPRLRGLVWCVRTLADSRTLVDADCHSSPKRIPWPARKARLHPLRRPTAVG